MASNDSEPHAPLPTAVKALVAGGFGVGKTTLVRTVSEITPMLTEELMTSASEGRDDTRGVEDKQTTTVALDFGRISLGQSLILYLFGTPGQERFWFMWDELAAGAIGAVILADTRRLADCFPAVDYAERRGLPFVLAVNRFDDAHDYTPEEVREALQLGAETPIVMCDVRDRSSAKEVLATLVRHALARLAAPAR